MNAPTLAQFAGKKYLSLESYRKDGSPVRTPVWFAEDNGTLYVYTEEDSGKMKRIRRNPRVRIAPCDMRGNLKGDWMDAEARICGPEEAARGNRLLDRKYWLKMLFNFTSKLRRKKRVLLAIKVG
jgi:PPOX class probable F420-dependent enzyme